MNSETRIEGNIIEYCLICLQRDTHLCKLDDLDKKLFFEEYLKVKIDADDAYPQSLCVNCDEKLSDCCSYLKQIKCSLEFWKTRKTKKKGLNEEEKDHYGHCSDDSDCKDSVEDIPENQELQEEEKKIILKTIEQYKQKFQQQRNCIFCGFVSETRRILGRHIASFHKDKKKNWCSECNNVYENLDKHSEIHKKNVCPVCQKEFGSNHYLEHLQSHTDKYKCKYCNKSCAAASSLKKHLLLHLKQYPYNCPNCSKKYRHPSSFSYHLKTHGKFECELCKKHFKIEKERNDHKCYSEGKDSELQSHTIHTITNTESGQQICERDKEIQMYFSSTFCSMCNRKVKNLTRHNASFHNPNGRPKVKKRNIVLKCEYCEKIFLTSHNYRLHLMSHTGETPYECKYCGKKVASHSRLVVHERTHTKEKPYICSVCGKAFGQNSALNTHMKQHTGRPEVCHLCSKTFCRKSELKLHIDKHTGLKPFLCTECGKAFAQKSHLTDHMRGHGEERPYQCTYCDKAFKKKVLLTGHLLIHRGIKQFQCSYCQYSCYKAYRLQQHLKLHKGERTP